LTRPRIKICCIASPEEAVLAVEAGADALGLVSDTLGGPGVLPEAAIAAIVARVPPPVGTFLLTGLTDPEAIAGQLRRTGAGAVQLVEPLVPEACASLRAACPSVRLVQVVHVDGERAVASAVAAAPHVDALLLDSKVEMGEGRRLGATGQVHDWRLSRRIVLAAGRPVFLAGGLRADNVARALGEVRPFGLDLCTGVRRDGALDPGLLHGFVTAVAAAGREGCG
jgi:phosphoribosylanthranilate isomerase